MKNVSNGEIVLIFRKSLDDFCYLVEMLCRDIEVNTENGFVFFTSTADEDADSNELDSMIISALSEYFDVNIVTFYAIDYPEGETDILIEYV